MSETRREFGIERVVCGCALCVLNCEAMPGYLVPSDLTRLGPRDQDDVFDWAGEHLRASPGAIAVQVNRDGSLERFRVPTLVPAHRADMSCHWLDPATKLCQVHAVSPFGCAFFSHDDDGGVQDKVRPSMNAIIDAWREAPLSLYAALWIYLDGHGLTSPPPEQKRAFMTRALAAKSPEALAAIESLL